MNISIVSGEVERRLETCLSLMRESMSTEYQYLDWYRIKFELEIALAAASHVVEDDRAFKARSKP